MTVSWLVLVALACWSLAMGFAAAMLVMPRLLAPDTKVVEKRIGVIGSEESRRLLGAVVHSQGGVVAVPLSSLDDVEHDVVVSFADWDEVATLRVAPRRSEYGPSRNGA